MLRRASPYLVAIAAFCSCATACLSAEITAERSADRVVVKIDGQLFTEYLIRCGTKPALWPIIGPTGERMTRDYPMAKRAGEKTDHPHQRSLWFSHGLVNGVNFWIEQGRCGTIRHIEFTRVASGKPAIIATRNAWLDPDGRKVCEDHRDFRFDTDGDSRWIDVDIALKATDGPVTFGDTKEGAFGMRVVESISVDAKLGGKMINSRGQIDNAAWGQPAEWIDYHGPLAGKTVGIAILNHPSSFQYPTRWHARPYGLLAANPFCLNDFTSGKLSGGGKTLSSGESLTLRYRVLLHRGDQREGRVSEAFSAYSKEAK
ncbi:MAG: PmoA family protein [Planctomycetaceae bacterium]|nr:PmoA family protein [Planctomycetaceae bacterium]